MSQIQKLFDGTIKPDIETLTGDVGGAVGPNGAFNISLLTTDGLTTTGTPLTNTITISPADDLAALEGLVTTGVASRTAANTWATSSITNHAVLVGNSTEGINNIGPLTNGQLVIGNTGNDPTAATLSAGTGVGIVNAAGSVTINAVGGGLTWTAIGASGNLAVNNGYLCTSGAALSLALPAASAVGDVISVALNGSTSWTITQAANQQIRIGSGTTSLGAGGSLASTAQGDTVTMVCTTVNLTWTVISVVGNITVV